MTTKDDGETGGAPQVGAADDASTGASVLAPKGAVAPPSAPTESFISLSPRKVAGTASLLAVACLTALVVVAAVEDAEALSTVALALAVLAFVIQIVVFIAQERAASEQAQQAERLNADTRALLTEVRVTSKSTADLVGQQYRQVLGAALQRVEGEAGKPATGLSAADLASALEGALQAGIPSSPPTVQQPPLSNPARARSRDRALGAGSRGVITMLKSFPTDPDELRSAVAVLTTLSAAAQQRLAELADDEIRSRQTDNYIGLSYEATEDDDELISAGLIEQYVRRVSGSSYSLVRLTRAGYSVARLMTASGEVPDAVARALKAGD